MKRRDFLISISSALAVGALTRVGAQPGATATPTAASSPTPTPPVNPVFTPLRRNVGTFIARGGTIGWLSSADALAVVDTQFPDTAPLCLKGLSGRNDRTLDVVINTHHHGDHTAGNGVFRPVAKHIVAHANVPEFQRRAAERALPPTVSQQVYADTTFPETWQMSLGDETVSAKYFGAAHTNGDIVVLFEKANVVHMGDLVFNRSYPVIDRVGGARIRHWVGVLETVMRDYPADAIYIFGHSGPKFPVTGQRSDLGVLRDYLTALLDHTQKEIAAGKTKEEIVTLKEFPGFPDFVPPSPIAPSRLPLNLGVAYDELTENA